jgi:hypothetical protein
MDDILASIRKIISDDEARAQVSGRGAPPSGASAANDAVRAGRPSISPREDVLLLTDLIDEPVEGQGDPQPPAPTPLPVTRIDPVRATEMPQPPFESEQPAPSMPVDSSLIGAAVAGATSSAFERLNQAVQQSEPTAAPVPIEPGPALGNGGKTIEDMVRELLRPMLKEWVDTNLPPMVERLVEREIARLTRR